jgi:hypothetical protein
MAGRCNLKQGKALKHGVYSTLGLLPGESPGKDVIGEFRPNGPVEHDIVMTIARAVAKPNLATFQTAQLVKFRHEFHPREFPEGSTQASKGEDIGGDLEFIAAVISGSVHKKQGQFLVIFLHQGLQKHSVSGAGRLRKMQIPSFGLTGPYK